MIEKLHQQTAASAVLEWSVLDNTLWNLVRHPTAHPSKTQFTTSPSDPNILSSLPDLSFPPHYHN